VAKNKSEKRKTRTADEQITNAEARLAKALRDVEQARKTLAKRERQLLAILEKHGRLPDKAATDVTGESGTDNDSNACAETSPDPELVSTSAVTD
jgi:hypothetical protein